MSSDNEEVRSDTEFVRSVRELKRWHDASVADLQKELTELNEEYFRLTDESNAAYRVEDFESYSALRGMARRVASRMGMNIHKQNNVTATMIDGLVRLSEEWTSDTRSR